MRDGNHCLFQVPSGTHSSGQMICEDAIKALFGPAAAPGDTITQSLAVQNEFLVIALLGSL